MITKLIEQYAKSLPESFPGTSIDALTNKVLRWRTIQNRRSRGEIPAECFVKMSSRKVIVLRDPFLAWLSTDIARSNDVHTD